MLSILKYLFTNLGIDLGTANTVVFADTKGFVVNQSSVIAFNNKNDVIAFGNEAKEREWVLRTGSTYVVNIAGNE